MTRTQLIQHRKKMGHSLADHAMYLGCPYSTYRKYESGDRSIPEDMEMRIAMAEKNYAKIVKLLKVRLDNHGWSRSDYMALVDYF